VKTRLAIASLVSAYLLTPSISYACSRAVYFGKEGQTVTGRTMDWFEADLGSNIWLYPRGLTRNSNTAKPTIWKSKYGSLVTTLYEGASADGMNEKGLVANLLYLPESKYPEASTGDDRPTLANSAWVQYVLDNYATVADLEKESFRMVAIKAPTGEPGTVHLSISDASGDSAIFEYLDGNLVIHHGRQYQVMTNSPTFDQQLALNTYWKGVGGTTFLPPAPTAHPIASCAHPSTSMRPSSPPIRARRSPPCSASCAM
jgi:penicillin V acylase-like amidase (Ntn superfamily)